MEAIVGGCGGSLERLSLTWASRLTDRALAALAKCERLGRQPLPSCRTLMRLLVLVLVLVLVLLVLLVARLVSRS